MGGAGAAVVPTAATWGPVPRLQGPAIGAVREVLFVDGGTDPEEGKSQQTYGVRRDIGGASLRAFGRDNGGD